MPSPFGEIASAEAASPTSERSTTTSAAFVTDRPTAVAVTASR